MRVAITGGTGFVGPAVVQKVLDDGHDVVVLEHKRPVDVADAPRLHRVQGDVRDAESLRRAFEGCDAVIHLVAILREKPSKGVTFQKVHVEGTQHVVDAAKAAGATRFLLMSANGVGDPNMPETGYFRTKAEMERIVKESGLRWTIFRPSYIAGSRSGGFDDQFADIVDKAPLLPSFDGGKFEIQPVALDNVAQAFARALERDDAVQKTYGLAGPERFTWNEYLRKLSGVRGKHRALVYAPAWAVMPALRAMGSFAPAGPDEVRMMLAGNVADPSEAVRDLGLDLERWDDAVSGLRR